MRVALLLVTLALAGCGVASGTAKVVGGVTTAAVGVVQVGASAVGAVIP